jgi:hypothetical protein
VTGASRVTAEVGIGVATPRVVVARRWTGLGDCLISLAAAWRYAHATRRALVADWRGSTYLPDGGNAFDRVFDARRSLTGVPFLAGDDVGERCPPGPYWPAGWTRERIERAGSNGESGQTPLAVRHIHAGHDVDQPVVVFDGCLAAAAPSLDELRAVFRALRPRPHLAAAARSFAEARLRPRPVLAVHVRHGNGGDIMGHGPHWERPHRTLVDLLHVTQAARHRLADATGADPSVLLCTDSPEVQAAFTTIVAGVVVRPKALRPAGSGELHRGPGAERGLADAAVEMLLLAEADVLVRFPARSFFSTWGAVLKRTPPVAVADLAPEGFGATIC